MMDLETAMLYSQLPRFKNLVAKTEQFIKDSLLEVSNPYVACSFGKDSSVMLHLVIKYYPNIVVKFLTPSECRLLDDYDLVIKVWSDTYGINLHEIQYKGWLETGNMSKAGVKNNITMDEHDSYFVGIRAEESKGRRITLRYHGVFYKMKNGAVRISPMAWWSTKDVAAYMYIKKLPILSKYLRQGMDARTSTSLSSRFAVESLSDLKIRDVESYNKLLKQFPDAKYFT